MAGSTPPYVRSKRREKWRQRKPFGDKESHLPTVIPVCNKNYRTIKVVLKKIECNP